MVDRLKNPWSLGDTFYMRELAQQASDTICRYRLNQYPTASLPAEMSFYVMSPGYLRKVRVRSG
jgi:hypothetical protein